MTTGGPGGVICVRGLLAGAGRSDTLSDRGTPQGHRRARRTCGDYEGVAVEAVSIANFTGAWDTRNLTVGDVHTCYVSAGDVTLLVHNNDADRCRSVESGSVLQ